MGVLTGFRKSREVKKIISIPWMPDELQKDLTGLELSHIQDIARITSRLATDDSNCRQLFLASLPVLVSRRELVESLLEISDYEIKNRLNDAVFQRAAYLLPSVVDAVDPPLPEDFPLNETLIQEHIASLLVSGNSDKSCLQTQASAITDNLSIYCASKNDWIDVAFNKTFQLLNASIGWDAYPGLQLNRSQCLLEFQDNWDWRQTPEVESTRLMVVLNRSPAKFISGYEDWQQSILETFRDAMCQQLSDSIPENCEIDSDSCYETASNALMETGFTELPKKIGDLPGIFMEAFKNDPCHHVKGLKEYYVEQAKLVFTNLAPQFTRQLPAGATLDRYACVHELALLVEQQLDPVDLVERFVKLVTDNPKTFINYPPTRDDRYESDSDQSMLVESPKYPLR